MVDLNEPPQTHTVVDGDTLQKLAVKYLDDPNRAMQIFEYNRDVLRTPDVLPIGAELRIPPRLAMPAVVPQLPQMPQSVDQSASTAPSTPAPTLAPASKPLVPLIAPAVKPAATQAGGPRTYTVQAGDNLVDIARKFYGDGRKNQDLFEANRRTMRNPGDLRPAWC